VVASAELDFVSVLVVVCSLSFSTGANGFSTSSMLEGNEVVTTLLDGSTIKTGYSLLVLLLFVVVVVLLLLLFVSRCLFLVAAVDCLLVESGGGGSAAHVDLRVSRSASLSPPGENPHGRRALPRAGAHFGPCPGRGEKVFSGTALSLSSTMGGCTVWLAWCFDFLEALPVATFDTVLALRRQRDVWMACKAEQSTHMCSFEMV
jgi:hypothetical protein